ncbi:MAG: nucleoside deaminase [Actinomycetota bacterium]|nr:nucleoside deaminase [Actinomycetota bacterium]
MKPERGRDADDSSHLAEAIRLAVDNIAAGGGPFGAVVVRDGEVLATGQNRVTRDNDPTAHAEVQAIRAACQAVGDFALTGAVIYSSCEPCPMCLAAAMWARVSRIVFAADRNDAAAGGFDDREFYDLFARERSTWSLSVENLRLDGAADPFTAWLASPERMDY